MKEMVETLGSPFLCVHRSFIVAVAHIKLHQPENVILNDGTYLRMTGF
jgi:two-component system response regulator LytT